MKKITCLLAICVIALMSLTTSCEKKLDVEQHGVIPMTEFYQTDEQCNAAMASLYYRMSQIYMQYTYVLNLMSGDMYAGDASRGSNKAIEELVEFTFDSSNNWILQFYQYLYQINYRANVVLANMTPDTPLKKQIEAECHFFRGWSHFYLAALWGTPPIVDHILTQDEYSIPNSNKADLWAFIENEFKTAAESGALPEKQNPNDVVIRVTKQTAQAYLGKAYVFDQKWAEARTTLDAVINSGKYALYTGPYENIILQAGELNCESIFETNVVEDPNNRLGGWPASSELVFSWRKAYMYINPGKGVITDNGYGIGWPHQELYDAFVAREGADGYRLNNSLKTYDQVKADGHYILDGITIEQCDGIFHWKTRADSHSLLFGGVYKSGSSHNNRRYMRYAEVLLLAAEAHLQAGGDASKALDYVNQIRTRAQLPALTSVTMDDVKIEKRLELCYENVRFLDLVRWGDGPAVLGNAGHAVPTFSSDGTHVADYEPFRNLQGGFRAGKNELLPFPKLEMISNKAMVQNPGY